METRGRIQLYPLLRVATALIAGILVAGTVWGSSSSWLIFGMLVATLVAAILSHRHIVMQSVMIFMAVFVMGMFVMTRHLERGEPMDRHLPALRQHLLDYYARLGLREQQFAVVAAMTLGDKSELSQATRNEYAVSGASHILALSGLHLGIIYAILSLIPVARRRRWIHEIVILTAIWAFVFLVGMPSSVVRAAVMITVYSALSMQNRQKMSLNVLSLTAVIMLLLNPMNLYDIGFQLSFASVASILLFYPLIAGILKLHNPIMRWIWQFSAVSIAAQIGAAPLVAYYFGRFSCYFLLANLVVIPAATIILYTSVLLFLLSFLPAVSSWLAAFLSYTTGLMNRSLSFIASLPGASIEGIHLHPIQVCAIYAMILVIYMMVMRFQLVGKTLTLHP